MRQFFKFLFASCLGVLLAMGALFFILMAVAGSVASGADAAKKVSANTVLHLKFDAAIPEKTNNLQINPFDLENQKVLGLHDLRRTIEHAKDDPNIKGIFIEAMSVPTGSASASVLRQAIDDFRENGKFVVSYSKMYTQGGYYMASAGDKIYLNPLGNVDFRGYGTQLAFFKDMLDDIGVKMEVFYVGQFKSATEPFRRTDMSEQNRLQVREYLEGLYGVYLNDIGTSRGKTTTELRAVADAYAAGTSAGALETGLVDVIGYRDEALTDIRTRLGLEEDDKLKLMTIEDYYPSAKAKRSKAKDRIAVVIAEGSIVDGKGENGQIGDEKYTKIISKLRKNDKVKAIVLRVNSGGGSAMSSENIWRELQLCRDAGKPVVVSMGDLAASGGYYIACAADTILAEPNTLTGSIGVFGMFPIVTELMNDKLGITFDSVGTGPMATAFLPTKELSQQEKDLLQSSTENIYEVFLKRVGDARNMTRDQVHEIAQGRVWTGKKAVEIGLVDQLGDLDDAMAIASRLANLSDYRMDEYPKMKEPLQQFIEEMTGQTTSIKHQAIQAELGEYYQYYEQIKTIQNMKGVQARMPFVLELR